MPVLSCTAIAFSCRSIHTCSTYTLLIASRNFGSRCRSSITASFLVCPSQSHPRHAEQPEPEPLRRPDAPLHRLHELLRVCHPEQPVEVHAEVIDPRRFIRLSARQVAEARNLDFHAMCAAL